MRPKPLPTRTPVVPRPSTALLVQLALRYAAWSLDSHLSRLPHAILLCVCKYLPVVAISDLGNRSAISYVDSTVTSLLTSAKQVCSILKLGPATDTSLDARMSRKCTDARGYCTLDFRGKLSVDPATPETLIYELIDGGDVRVDELRHQGVSGTQLFGGTTERVRIEYVWPGSASEPLLVRLWMVHVTTWTKPQVCMTLALSFAPSTWPT